MKKVDPFRDRYGFFFWLGWILWFAGSFVLAALGWTNFMKYFFGAIGGAELTLTWVVAVFGTWFILVIPFMRKKEQIWKRLNTDQERAVDAWLLGMGIFIGSLTASALGWGFVFKKQLHITSGGIDGTWLKAVLGSWLAILIPFLILMYRKADAIFQTANSRQTYEPNYRRQFVEKEKRLLSDAQALRLAAIKPVLPGGHLLRVKLRDGRLIPYVFVSTAKEILGVYDRERFDFESRDIVDIEPVLAPNLPAFETSKWLRLDLSSD